jgi:hypothetical protein
VISDPTTDISFFGEQLMLKEALDKLQDTAVKAAGVEIKEIPGDERTVLVCSEGKPQERPVPPPLRYHSVLGLNDIVDAAGKWGADKGVLWHNERDIILVVNDEDRREYVSMDLRMTEHFRTLAKLETTGKSIDQRAMVNLLRHDLLGVLPETLLPIVRKLKVATGAGTESELQPGRERGTDEFKRELAGAADLPEVVNAVCSVYSAPGLQAKRTIRLSLAFDVTAMTFTLLPLPDEMNAAVQNAQLELHAQLVEALPADYPVFYGTP